mmetsp:Transcript_13742/g.23621  ORF Transcript_13742/g.23621 Transcript_13742/m.23621 type:complete len:202 (+) Transcript_13742:106-711(+)
MLLITKEVIVLNAISRLATSKLTPPSFWKGISHSADDPCWLICWPLFSCLLFYQDRISGIFMISLSLGLFFDALFVLSLKAFFKRSRPEPGRHEAQFVPVDAYSFPSGHASRMSFMVTWTLHSCKPYVSLHPFLFLLLLLWAALVLLGRVALRRHYPTDVIFGLLNGTVSCRLYLRISPILIPFLLEMSPTTGKLHLITVD